MAFKVKVPPEKKLEAVLRYLNGEIAKTSFETGKWEGIPVCNP